MQSKHAKAKIQGGFPVICAKKSGKQVPIDVFNKMQARGNRLLEQSHDVCRKLESEGVQAYVENDLTLVGLHSGMTKKVEDFRNIIFIPSVAKMRRAPEVKFVQYALQDYPMARNWTITSGTRVVVPRRKTAELGAISEMASEIFEHDHQAGVERARERFREMTRKVSRLNQEDFMKEAGAEFTYWTKEFGEVFENEEGLSIHPHLHCILILKRGRLQKHRWSLLLERIQEYLGTYSHDCGVIKNPREFVKYCVKPDDLTELSASSVADLYQVTRHMRMQQPLGVFRKIKRTLKENHLGVTWLDGKLVTVQRFKKKGLSKKDKPWQPPSGFRDQADPVVVARIEPAPVFAPVTEPLLLVHGLAGRDAKEWVIETFEVQELLRSISIYTKSLIVRKQRRERMQKYESEPKIPPKLIESSASA